MLLDDSSQKHFQNISLLKTLKSVFFLFFFKSGTFLIPDENMRRYSPSFWTEMPKQRDIIRKYEMENGW